MDFFLWKLGIIPKKKVYLCGLYHNIAIMSVFSVIPSFIISGMELALFTVAAVKLSSSSQQDITAHSESIAILAARTMPYYWQYQ